MLTVEAIANSQRKKTKRKLNLCVLLELSTSSFSKTMSLQKLWKKKIGKIIKDKVALKFCRKHKRLF
jgi:hypothetical protein